MRDARQLEHAHRVLAAAPREHIPIAVVVDEDVRLDHPLGDVAAAVVIADLDRLARLFGGGQRVQLCAESVALRSVRKVYRKVFVGKAARARGRAHRVEFEQHLFSEHGRGGKSLDRRDDVLKLRLVEECARQTVVAADRDASALALVGHDGDARRRKHVDVAIDRAFGHFEAFGQLFCGEFVVGEKLKQHDESIGYHRGPPSSLFYHARARTSIIDEYRKAAKLSNRCCIFGEFRTAKATLLASYTTKFGKSVR